MRKTFLYYLFNEDKKPLYVDENNNIQEGNKETFEKSNGQPAHLQYSPDGWKDTLVKYARNIKYWGLFRDMSVPMKFVMDGAKILRRIMWSKGIEGICYLGISKLDRTQLPYKYESWYLSEMNFSKMTEIETGMNIEALEGGISKYLKSNENTVYEINIGDDPEGIKVKMDGMAFTQTYKFLLVEDQTAGPTKLGIGRASEEKYYIHPGLFVTDFIAYSAYVIPPHDSYVIENSTDASIEFTFSGTINTKFLDPNPSLNVFWVQAELQAISGGAVTNTILAEELVGGDQNELTSYTLSGTITVPTGYRVYIYVNGNILIQTGTLEFSYPYIFRETETVALPIYTLFKRLIEKVTENKYTVSSSLLSSLTGYAVTSGTAIRNSDKKIIKSSFSDFFKTVFARFSAGLDIDESLGFGNEKVRVERFADFFGSTVLLNLGEVANVELSIADDLIYNTIKAGYAKKDYEDVNGRFEYNQGQIYSTPVTKVIKELDLQSPYRADPYGIEFQRMKFNDKETTDSEADNDTFLLNINEVNIDPSDTFSTSVTGTHSYSGQSEVIYDVLDLGTDFTANVAQTEFTYIGSKPQSVTFDLSITPTGGGGVTDIEVAILINGTPFTAQMLPVGSTNGITISVPIVKNDILSIQVDGMAGALNVNQSTINFTYQKAGTYELNRPAGSITGIPHPDTAYNLLLTPKYGLINNGAYLHSIFDLMETGKIKFQSSDKNAELSTTLSGLTVSEKADLEIGGLPAQLFKPYYFKFKTEVPVNLLALINSNPYGKVQFQWNGRQWYGYMVDGGVKPGDNDTQTWQLLCSPENDLSKFNG